MPPIAVAPSSSAVITFKIATEPVEFEQIHRFNYQTFVEEIPQHAPNPEGRLVDKFHAENTYVIGVADGRVVAMLALRGRRPFSLDAKLPDLDRYLPPGRRIVEVRLLAVAPAHRHGPVFHRLLHFAVTYLHRDGYDVAIISGTTRQLKLYGRLGFVPFGPLVGAPGAWYQPMALTLERLVQRTREQRALRDMLVTTPPASTEAMNFLPGPVAIARTVQVAFSAPPVSHRGLAFQAQFAALRQRLCRYAGALHVQVLLGSGSLGTDCIAAQLSVRGGPGLILSTGEFGERLAAHARRFDLRFDWLRRPWGHVVTPDELEAELSRRPSVAWVWLVHHETSTGVMHPLPELAAVASRHGIRLCVDAISSLGVVPIDLSGVSLATSVSGKGLGSFPGLALVFHAQAVETATARLPRYLDLGEWDRAGGIPFTHSSNLITALDVALAEAEAQGSARFEEKRDLAEWFRQRLRAAGFKLVAPESHACPAVVSIALPAGQSAMEIGADLEARGFLLSYLSGYLRDRNWIQVGLMGTIAHDQLDQLLVALAPYTPV